MNYKKKRFTLITRAGDFKGGFDRIDMAIPKVQKRISFFEIRAAVSVNSPLSDDVKIESREERGDGRDKFENLYELFKSLPSLKSATCPVM